jgi:hypothetical protein
MGIDTTTAAREEVFYSALVPMDPVDLERRLKALRASNIRIGEVTETRKPIVFGTSILVR